MDALEAEEMEVEVPWEMVEEEEREEEREEEERDEEESDEESDDDCWVQCDRCDNRRLLL